jgi:hypothetical protein
LVFKLAEPKNATKYLWLSSSALIYKSVNFLSPEEANKVKKICMASQIILAIKDMVTKNIVHGDIGYTGRLPWSKFAYTEGETVNIRFGGENEDVDRELIECPALKFKDVKDLSTIEKYAKISEWNVKQPEQMKCLYLRKVSSSIDTLFVELTPDEILLVKSFLSYAIGDHLMLLQVLKNFI